MAKQPNQAFWRMTVCCAVLAVLSGCQSIPDRERDYIDLSKREVIAALGIPTRANPISHRAIGGPGFEIWDYYQLSETGEVEVVNVIFGNSMQNLGKVVSYSVGIDRSRIIDSDTPDGMSRILEYDRKSQPFE